MEADVLVVMMEVDERLKIVLVWQSWEGVIAGEIGMVRIQTLAKRICDVLSWHFHVSSL